jgi:hypothetical protein
MKLQLSVFVSKYTFYFEQTRMLKILNDLREDLNTKSDKINWGTETIEYYLMAKGPDPSDRETERFFVTIKVDEFDCID